MALSKPLVSSVDRAQGEGTLQVVGGGPAKSGGHSRGPDLGTTPAQTARFIVQWGTMSGFEVTGRILTSGQTHSVPSCSSVTSSMPGGGGDPSVLDAN